MKALTIYATGTTATTGAASAAVALPKCSDGSNARFVRIQADGLAYVKVGASTVTATTNDILLTVYEPVVLQVTNSTHFAHIQHTGAQKVNVVALEG